MPFMIRPNRHILLPLIALLLGVGPVYAEWVKVGETNDGMSVYYDPDTIDHKGNLGKMWVLYDFKTPQKTNEGISFMSLTTQEEYDCTEERARILAVRGYAGKMQSGKVAYFSSGESQWVPISPDTYQQNTWTYLCVKK